MDEPRAEPRMVDHVKTVTYPNCSREGETSREEPWIIAGDEQYVPQLVAFVCPH